jgi:hypothetical protein
MSKYHKNNEQVQKQPSLFEMKLERVNWLPISKKYYDDG